MENGSTIGTRFVPPSAENGHNWLIRTSVGSSVIVETKCKSLQHVIKKSCGHWNKVIRELSEEK